MRANLATCSEKQSKEKSKAMGFFVVFGFFLGKKCFPVGTRVFFASYFLSKKSCVNYKTVNWVAKNCCPLLDASMV
jgi:hypothetical protein